MSNGYKITRSNYTLKQRRQVLSGGVVFERDFMTTTNLGPWSSGSIPYGESNFKMYYRQESNAKKRVSNSEWLKNECDTGNTGFWTADCVPSSGTSEEEQIKIKPNYNSLLDFCYYGSCVELIKSTVTNIIKTFPAEMYVVNGDNYGFYGNGLLINNFEINLRDTVIPEGENPLRYFLKSYSSYYFNSNGSSRRIIGVTYKTKNTPGLNTREKAFLSNGCNFLLTIQETAGTHIFSGVTYNEGVSAVLTDSNIINCSISPDSSEIEKFFNGLDDFSKVLLNEDTTPKYSAILDTPFETERGVETYQRRYTWPSDDGVNIEISGERFQQYIDGLLSIAEFYDEYYTDNLWRMLTHDSIKAMDIAFSNPEKDEDSDDYNAGASRLEGLFWAIGRQFDEIKRSIDNVKNTPNVTYNGNNNVPDYFLSDALSLNGWEVHNIDLSLAGDEKIYGKSANDANNIFLRNLKLNSKDILSKKGTRQGIEALLGVFGMKSYDMSPYCYDYKIDEYIGVVDSANHASTTSSDLLPIENANLLKLSNGPDGDGDRDTMEGIPCDLRYVLTNGDVVYKYLIPWFDKNKEYDGDLYFQMLGGWGRHHIAEGGFAGSGFDETVKYVIVVDNVSDLRNIPQTRLYDGAIAYVENMEGLYLSHYYKLVDKDFQYLISEGDGWQNMPEDSYEIFYAEQIVEDFKANNPHMGHTILGIYDYGEEYIEYLRKPLKYALDNDKNEQMFDDEAYDCEGNLVFNESTFAINGYVRDNMKCWYFEPVSDNNNSIKVLTKTGDFSYSGSDEAASAIGPAEGGTTFESDAYTYDFVSENTGYTATDITCDSIVNTKRMSIMFYIDGLFKDEFDKFLSETVMPYLRQVLPSDVIFEYDIEAKNVVRAEMLNTTGGVQLAEVSVIAGDNYGTSNDDAIVNVSIDDD